MAVVQNLSENVSILTKVFATNVAKKAISVTNALKIVWANDSHHLKKKKKKNLNGNEGCSKNQESYPSSEEDTAFYDKTKNFKERNSEEEECDLSHMETLSAVIHEEQENNIDILAKLK